MTLSRGVRMSEQQFGRVWEVFLDVTKGKPKDSPVQLNELFTVLIELGLDTYSRIPLQMRQGLFRKRKYQAQEEFDRHIEAKVAKIGEQFRLDERLAFQLPRPMKQLVRQEAEQHKTTMSAVMRGRIALKETA